MKIQKENPMPAKSNIITREVTVVNCFGLHARPAAMIARAVSNCTAEVWFIRENGERIMASSALSILMMAAGKGTRLTIEAGGDGAQDIVDRLSEDFAAGFGEME